jgi:hypothetical protein
MLWKDWSISLYIAVNYILIKFQSQGNNHARNDDKYDTADDCKVDLYAIENDVMNGLKYMHLNSVRYSLIKLPPQGDDNHIQPDDKHSTADDRKVDLYSIEKDVKKGLKYI